MGVFERFFAPSPFKGLHEHSKKVHKCVELLEPLVEALLNEQYDRIEKLHNEMSRTEHEADVVKNEIRDQIHKLRFISVGHDEIVSFLAYQDDIADRAEDFAVLLLLRKTRIPEELREDFQNFVKQVIAVSERLMALAEELSVLAESAFAGKEVDNALKGVDEISEGEWLADRLARRFAQHIYSIEDKLDPITIFFLDKYCKTLGQIANNAERTAKYLRLIIRKR